MSQRQDSHPAMATPVTSDVQDFDDPIDADLTITALNSQKPSVHETTREQTPDHTEEDGEKDEEQHISFRAVERVDVSVQNLAITVSPHSVRLPWAKKTEKVPEIKILDHVSADFPAGELTAIIGGSGSGKVCTDLKYELWSLLTRDVRLGRPRC